MPIPQFLAGEALPASKLQQLGDDDTYTPGLVASVTNPGLGTNPTQDGQTWLNGQLVNVFFEIIFGTTATAGSGTYQVALPSAHPFSAAMADLAIGQARLIDNSSGAERIGILIADTANDRLWIRTTDNFALVTNAAPWTFADLDTINGHYTYLTDTP